MSDYTVVYFTGIDRGFSIPSTLANFTLFGSEFEIRWYGVLIALGFLMALIAGTKLAKKNELDIDSVYDVIIFGTIFAIIGARLYYVAFQWDYYSSNLGDIIKINEGGLAIYGGIIFALISAAIVCKIRKVNILKFLDCVGVGFLIGQGIGRWGNFTNQEAFGTNTTMPWGMTSKKITEYIQNNMSTFEEKGISMDSSLPVHPTFLYESLWCLLGAVLLYIMFVKFKKFDGQIILSYGVWYGLERMIVEGFRTDSLYIGSSNLRVSQLISLIAVVICLGLLIYGFIKKSKGEKIDAKTTLQEQE